MPIDKKLDPAARNPADLERMIRKPTERSGRLSRKAAQFAYWAAYPATLVECALMASLSSISYGLLRAYYLKWWYPEKLRRRPRRMLKDVIDVENALAGMQTIERIGRDSRAGLFWISGTLLGLERLAQPLPHDNDLDLGLDIDDPHGEGFVRALWASPDISEMAPQRLSWKTRIQNPDLHHVRGGIIRYKAAVRNPQTPHKPAVKLDLFLHFPYCGGSMHGTRNSIWWNTTPGVVKHPYGDREFSVPADAHLYLTENYGDYRREVKDFENSIDCPNVMNIFSWRSLATLVSRQQMMLKLGRPDRAHQINKRIMATILKGLIPFSDKPRIAHANISADKDAGERFQTASVPGGDIASPAPYRSYETQP